MDPNRFRQYVYGQQHAVGIAVEDSEWARVTEDLYKVRLQLEQLSAVVPVQKSVQKSQISSTPGPGKPARAENARNSTRSL